jgi:hypothetical protein
MSSNLASFLALRSVLKSSSFAPSSVTKPFQDVFLKRRFQFAQNSGAVGGSISLGTQVLMLLSTLLVTLPMGHAQLKRPFPPTSITTAPPVLPPTATSDPAAVGLLERVIESSGGKPAWRTLHSAKIRLTVTSAGPIPYRDVLMLDDWSSDAVLYRRGTVGSKRAPTDHSGQAALTTISREGKTRQIPEFDQARVLAGSLPAAAAGIILRRTIYIVKQELGPRCTTGSLCVDIYRQQRPQEPFVREEEWVISQSSGLPTEVDLLLPNLTGHRPIFEEFQFDQMMTQSGLQIPSKIELRPPGGGVQIRTVVSFTPNAAFDKTSFDQELSQ